MAARLPVLLIFVSLMLFAETPAQQCNRAWVLIEQHKHQEAFQLLKSTIRENPAFARAYRLMGEACGSAACREEALQFLTSAGPGPRELALGHYGKGSIYSASTTYAKGSFAPVSQELAACIRADPDRAECYLGLAYSFGEIAPTAQTLRNAERLVAIDPRNPAAPLLEGGLLIQARKFLQARQVLKQGLAVALEVKRDDLAALYSRTLGDAYAEPESAEAAQYYQLSLDHAIRADDMQIEIGMLLNRAGSDSSADNRPSGARRFDEALARIRAAGAWNLEVNCLRQVAKQEVEAGDLSAARNSLRAAKGRCLSGLNRICAPDILLELADVERSAGSPQAALESYEAARDIAKTTGQTWQDAMACRGIANIYADSGEYFKALEWGTQSVQLFEQIGYMSPAGASSANLGDVYAELGDFANSQRAYKTALAAARSYVDKGEEGRTLISMGLLALRAGRPAQAVPLLEQGQKRMLAVSNRAYQVLASTALARGLLQLGRQPEALAQARSAATLAAELEIVKPQAEALLAQGDCHLALGQPAKAREVFSRSLELAESAGHVPVAVQARRGLAQAEIQQGNLPQALPHYRQAIDELESIRGALPGAAARSGLLEQNWVYYSEIVSLLARLHARQPGEGLDRLALSYAERARARALLDNLAEARASNSDLPAPLTAAQIQATLAGTNDAILEFSLGGKRSQAWLIMAGATSMIALPPRESIAGMVTRYRRFATVRPKGDLDSESFLASARELHNTLIAPLSRKLAGVRNLTIIADGALHYLPFESLISSPPGQPARFLIEDLAIHYAPSASLHAARLSAKPSPAAPMDLLAYGDPQYSRAPSPNVAAPDLVRRVYESAGARFPQLPNTRIELSRIGALFPAGRERLLLGAAATEASVKSEQLTRYRILHFAAHAILDEAAPQRSGIVLSLTSPGREDGVLRSAEILNLRLDADLVVLSACQTGLGKLVRGEGVVGLTRAFLHAGARRVVVSLWEANDAATPDLMHGFYKALRQGQGAAEALRTAKLAMLRSGAPAYRHPYFWAGFVLAGRR